MTWRLAKTMTVCRNELDALYPHRDRTSDGTIGDPAHAARSSKHNPGPDGIVEAWDADEDLDGSDAGGAGAPLWPLVAYLLKQAKAGHPGLAGPGAHLIYEGRIWSHARGWVEHPYTGENAHRHHAHIACVDGAGKDSLQPYHLALAWHSPPPKPDRWLGYTNPRMSGPDVAGVIRVLRSLGNSDVSGDVYTRRVGDVIRVFQQHRGIVERGVGPKTWAALRKVAHG